VHLSYRLLNSCYSVGDIMVWARTKLTIWDYVFEPIRHLKITYSGKNADKFYKKINELVRTVFNVPEGYVQEKNYKWEKDKDTIRFDVQWEVNKILDQFTFIRVDIDLVGYAIKQGDSTEGKAAIRIAPRLVTEYPQDTVWQQNIFYEIFRRLWHTAIYHKKRMEYLDLAKDLVTSFEAELKHFGEEQSQ